MGWFFCILASLCFCLYLVLLKPEQIFKIVNEETGHGEVEVHVPSSKTSELSEPEISAAAYILKNSMVLNKFLNPAIT